MARVGDDKKYEELCQDFRSLNGFFWQTPLIVMTLNGGLWFSVANFDLSSPARAALLGFAAVADLLMIISLIRLRTVMQGLQEQIRGLDGRPAIGRNKTILTVFSLLIALAAVGSAMAMSNPSGYFMERPAADCAVPGNLHGQQAPRAATRGA